MDNHMNGQVALLVDFENLVTAEGIDGEILIAFAEKYGRVLTAKAYAHWNNPSYFPHQGDLYRIGIDIVQVISKGGKNSVDIKLAVDAVDMIHSMPHINVFVIASGDRDFIHIHKTLRSHGKTVIGISSKNAASSDLARFCDRFVMYEDVAGVQQASEEESIGIQESDYQKKSVLGAFQDSQPSDLMPVKQAIQLIIAAHPDGILGAKLKILLRQELSPTFDESAYGFKQFKQLLHALKDIVVLKDDPRSLDILVCPASDVSEHSNIPTLVWQLTQRARRFNQNAKERRNILKIIFAAIDQKQPFSFGEICERIANMETEDTPSRTVILKYLNVIFLGRGFSWESSQDMLKVSDRMMSLREDINSEDAFIRCYEQAIVHRLRVLVGDEQELSASLLANILGLSQNENTLEYCQSLLDALVDAASSEDASAQDAPAEEALPDAVPSSD